MRPSLIFLLAAAVASTAPAQRTEAPPPLRLPRLSSPVTLDGYSNESAWAGVQPIVPVMFQPTYQGTPSQRTEFRLAYDDNYLYASARLYVRSPDDIRGNSLHRDVDGADDTFMMLIDSFNDNENGFGFATTPSGVRIDYAIGSDGQSFNAAWNTFWDVATSRADSGWFAEMRIPFSSLRFQSVDGRVTMGVRLLRGAVALNERFSYPPSPPQLSNAPNRLSLAQKIELEGIEPRRPLYVTPYVLGGTARQARLEDGAVAYSHRSTTTREMGADLKFGLSSNLTLDATVNTDFAQSEADDQQVNLSRFSLFFPEKRQFFLERASIFEMNTGGFGDASRLFHSRQIGLTAAGTPIGILGGARLVGRVGRWDVGVLNMQTEKAGNVPSENFGVARVRRNVLNPGSTIGGIFTSRVNVDGRHNYTYGTDALLRVLPNDYLTVQWAQTFDDANRSAGADNAMARFLWERRADKGLVYRLGAKWSGPDHRPALGFQPRTDYRQFETNLRYGWFPGSRTVFQSIQPSLLAVNFVRNRDGVSESSSVTQFLNYAFKSGYFGNVNANVSSELLPSALTLAPGVVVPAGRHTYATGSAFVGTPIGNRLRANIGATAGEIYDGTRWALSVGPSFTVSRHVTVQAEYNANRLQFRSRGQSLEADIARLRLQAALSTRLSFSGFTQYNRANDVLASNVRLRVHLSEGRDLFIVYNEQLNTDREGIMPVLPVSQDRTLLVKLTYTFFP
jgi:hypothetical protein